LKIKQSYIGEILDRNRKFWYNGCMRKRSQQLANDPYKTTPRQPEELAYAAGLFDGEGFVSLCRTGYKPQNENFVAGQYRLAVSVSMCDSEAVLWLHKTFGGRLQKVKAQKKEWRDAFRWTVETDSAISFLQEVGSWLKVKKHQVALTFKFREIVKQARYKIDPQLAERAHYFARQVQQMARKGKHRESVETTRSAPSVEG
jgi:hypothetical protein